ncbi:hypothetical protein D3C78_1344900 [compost metagenome]
MSYHCKKRDSRKRRHRNRQVNAPQRAELAGTVNERRLLQLLRHCPEKIHQQHHVKYIYRSRQHKRPNRIHQIQIADEHVARYDSAAEQHREQKVPRIHWAAAKHPAILRKRIAGQYHEKHSDCRSKQGTLCPHQQSIMEIIVIERLRIGVAIQADRP